MSDLRAGDRVVVVWPDTGQIEYHGRYAGRCGPLVFVLPDDDDQLGPVEVGADRVFHENGHRPPPREV